MRMRRLDPLTRDRVAKAVRLIDPDDVIRLARRLVQIPSISGHEGHAIVALMAEWLRAAGIDAVVQDLDPDRANIYARIAGNEPGPKLLLNGHLDTVPADGMSIDPFAGAFDGHRLSGRGAVDMKSALAAQMAALKAIRQSGVPFDGELWFGSEVGEEGGGWRLDALLPPGPIDCDLAVVGEPTELQLCFGCRGGLHFVLETTGVTTHSGMAERGVNAILAAARCIPIIYELPCLNERDPVWGRCAVNVQDIRGGGLVDRSVPDHCVATFDVRLNPGTSVERARIELDAALENARAADPTLRVAWRLIAPAKDAVSIDPSHPFVLDALDAIECVTASPPRLGGFPGGCSAIELIRRGVPTVIYGPGSVAQAHSSNEWVDTDQVITAAAGYVAIALASMRARREPPEP